MIKNYSEFLFESNVDEIITFIAGMTRAYNNDVYLGHFIIEFELRKWKELKDTVQLRKTIKFPGIYHIKFIQDDVKYNFVCKFDFSFFGQNEMDVPDSSFAMDETRLGIVLDDIEIKHLEIRSKNIEFNSSNISERLNEELVRFLIKVMASDYDILSSKLQSLQQEVYD